MSSLQRILLYFGTTTFVSSAAVFFALHDFLKYHGRVQLGLCAVGFACVLIARLGWRRRP